MLHDAPVTSKYRFQYRAPTIGAMDVARPQHTPLDIAELVEHEQWVITGAGKVAIVGAAFLFAVGRTFARIHVEYDGLRPSSLAHFVNPLTGPLDKSGKGPRPAQPLRLQAAHLAGRAGRPADCSAPNYPTHCRVTAQPL